MTTRQQAAEELAKKLLPAAIDFAERENTKVSFLAGCEYTDGEKWISVKDRLPEERFMPVLIFDANVPLYRQHVQQAAWFQQTKTFKIEVTGGHINADDITHWMPLPSPPSFIEREQPKDLIAMETNDEKKARVTFDEQPEKCEKCPAVHGCKAGECKYKHLEQPEKYYCQTCKAEINEGEFKTFGVCDNCWDFHYRKPEAAGQEQEKNAHPDEYLARILYLSLDQRDCTTDQGVNNAVEETMWNLKQIFNITRKAQYDAAMPEQQGQEQEEGDTAHWMKKYEAASQQTASLQKQLEEQRESLTKLNELLQIRDEKKEVRMLNMQKENGGLYARIEQQQEEIERMKTVLKKVNTAIYHSNLKNTLLHDEIRKALQSPPGESEKENNK